MNVQSSPHVRTARRLTRLFRMERRGRFERLPVATARLLVERRSALIGKLTAVDWCCHGRLPEFDSALRELAAEVDCARVVVRRRRDELVREIRYNGNTSTGLRSASAGQLLGRG